MSTEAQTMMADHEMETFLREGLTHYVGASDAIETFEREIQSRLLRLLEAKAWRAFSAKESERGRGDARWSGVWQGPAGRIIYACQAAADGGWIDLKLWWQSPRERDRVLMCCGRWDTRSSLRKIELADPQPPLQCGPIEKPEPHLFVVLDGQDDMEVLGGLLLDEMDRALGNEGSG
jgi:hypothetical protein